MGFLRKNMRFLYFFDLINKEKVRHSGGFGLVIFDEVRKIAYL